MLKIELVDGQNVPGLILRITSEGLVVDASDVSLVAPFEQCEDGEMPKVNPPAISTKMFTVDDEYQARFDAWKAEIEQGGKFVLEIVGTEKFDNPPRLVFMWRVVPTEPKPYVAKRKGCRARSPPLLRPP